MLIVIVFSKILSILLVLASIVLTIIGTALSNRSTNNFYAWAFVSFLLAMVWAFAGKGIEDIENRQATTTHTTIQRR